jgi:hypothetical protein
MDFRTLRRAQKFPPLRLSFFVVADDAPDALLVEDLQLRRERDNGIRRIAEHLPVIRRQPVPRHIHVVVMRIMEAEIQREPVGPVVLQRMRIGKRVLLFPLEVALARRLFELEQGQAVGIVVLQAVHET